MSGAENEDKEIRAQTVRGGTGQGQLCTRSPGLTLASILGRRWAAERKEGKWVSTDVSIPAGCQDTLFHYPETAHSFHWEDGRKD